MTAAVRQLLHEEFATLETVARLASEKGALFDLRRERAAVLGRGVRPIDLRGWELEHPTRLVWEGCRDPTALTQGLGSESAAVALHLLSLVHELYGGGGGGGGGVQSPSSSAAATSAADRAYESRQRRPAVAPHSRSRSAQRSSSGGSNSSAKSRQGLQAARGPASAAAAPARAQARWPFALPQWPEAAKLGGVEDGPLQGTFGVAPRFGQGGIYSDEVKARVPIKAKQLINQLVGALVGRTASTASHRRLGKPVFGTADPKGVFAAIDTDGSGELDEHEFGEALRRLGMALPPQQSANLLAALDTDHSGTIDYQEFQVVVQLAIDAEAQVAEKSAQAGVARGASIVGSVHGGGSLAPSAREEPLGLGAGSGRQRMTAHGRLGLGCQEVLTPHTGTFSTAARFAERGAAVRAEEDVATRASGLIRRFVAVLGTKRTFAGVALAGVR
eukprot:COSAG01_NODE_317_length_18969_cov_378.101219_16_plen_446_part_00